jgi:hypothetical protein
MKQEPTSEQEQQIPLSPIHSVTPPIPHEGDEAVVRLVFPPTVEETSRAK